MTRYDIAKFYGYNSPEEYDEAQRRKHEIFVESKKMQKTNAEKEPVKIQPVISGDNCIVCGRNVHKDDVYYDVNGGTICEACMNTKCKCKNGR